MKKIICAIALMVAGTFGILIPSVAYAADEKKQDDQTTENKCPEGIGGTYVNNIAECGINATGAGKEDKLFPRINAIINVVLGVIGVVAVVMIILGGVNFVMSQGDASKVAKARNTILYGVVGLIVALLAFSIVNFVLSGVFSGSTTSGSGDTSKTTDKKD